MMQPTRIVPTTMEQRRCLFVCLFLCVMVVMVKGDENAHGMLCRSNELFLSCGGCQRTCQDPAPMCVAVCRPGCYCPWDLVRNETGHCVELAECPSVSPSRLHSTEPRLADTDCPPDEEYRVCETCNRTCENPNPICPAQCARGCFCRDDLLRDKDGRCVAAENCSSVRKNESSNYIKPIAYQLTCGTHQVYNACRACEQTCSSPTPVCRTPCSAGCFCEDGFLKAPSGNCVKLEDCPRAEMTIGAAQEPSIEDCSNDEIYLSCGWCEPSCWEPRPECPRGVCTRGCLCRPPLLRHHSGHCVPQHDCSPQKCTEANEEFVCRYGCEARCDAKKCVTRPRRCVLGCHCKLGLYRDVSGKCVTFYNCLSNKEARNASNISSFSDFNSNGSFTYNSSEEDPRSFNGSVIFSDGAPKSVFDIVPEGKTKPYTDVISRAVKMYRQFLNTPSSVYGNLNMPIKDLSARNYRDESGFITKEGLKANDVQNSQFFIDPASKPNKEANVKNYMNDLISVMKEMMPQPMNLTFVNYPLWNN